jgi:hypothetical protein
MGRTLSFPQSVQANLHAKQTTDMAGSLVPKSPFHLYGSSELGTSSTGLVCFVGCLLQVGNAGETSYVATM